MIIQTLTLYNFRSFIKTEFSFSPLITFIAGPNATGKTTVLEAISFLSTASGFRTSRDPEMVSFESEIGRARGTVQLDGEEKKLEIVLTRGEVMGVKTGQKKYSVNGVPKRSSDFVGNLLTVLFSPQDLELVTDSPSLRRHYLDSVLSQADRDYHRSLSSYERGIRQRNRLLEAIRDTHADPKQLIFWDQLIIKDGEYITEKREEYITYVNNFQFPLPLLAGISNFKFPDYSILYDKSVISQERLFAYKDAEIASAATLVGPHRDDMVFKLKVESSSSAKASADREKFQPLVDQPLAKKVNEERELALFGSRGEQRLGVLWLKLAELAYLTEKREEKPILLLDDIFSELDHSHQEMVLAIIKNQQTIITTTDMEWIENWIHLNHNVKTLLITLG